MNRTSVRAWLKVAVAAVLLGCGGDGGTNPPPANPGFTLTPSGTTLSVEQGASASLLATIGRTGSFTGTVELSTENVPTGLTAVFSPSSITSSVTSASLTVTAALTVAPGSYNFTVRGKANGLTDQTFQASVTVTARPAIAIALNPPSASVGQGGNSSYVANITRTNFTGAVAVAVTGAPTGVTTTVTPNGNAYTVAIGVATSTAPGTYQLVTTASGTGVANVSSSFALTVTAVAASFELSLAQTAITMGAGTGANIDLNISRTNFTGAVNLAVTGAPALFNTQLGDTAPTGNSTILSLLPFSGVAAGTYTLTVTGTATGLPTRTATIAVTVTPFVNVQLTATPDSLNFLQGGTVSTTITILRENFPDALTLTASGVPNGVTATFNASPTTANSAQLSFSAGVATPIPGAYTITVTASATGISPRTTTLRLIVPGPMGISLSAAPTSLSIAQGAGSTTTITIARTGFTGAVNLAATAPSGVTVTFNPNNTMGNTSTATISVSGSASTGNGFINVTGSGTGISDAPLQIPLTVTTGSGGSGNITYTFCGEVEDIPVWLAVQNGTGAWTVVNGVTTGPNKTFTFTISSNGGIAWVTQSNNGDAKLTITYGLFSEFQGQASSNCGASSTTGKTLTGTVSGVGPTQLTSISLGSRATGTSFGVTNFTLTNVEPGPLDLVAVRNSFGGANQAADKVIIRRAQNFADNSVIPVLNFSSEGENTLDYTATLTGLTGGELGGGSVTLLTPSASATLSTTQLSGNTFPFVALSAGALGANDYHLMSGFATLTTGSESRSRSASYVFKGGANQTLALGPSLSTITPSNIAGAPYARIRVQFAKQSEYTKLFAFQWTQGGISTGGMTTRGGSITATEAFLGSTGTVDLSIPDFSALPGWLNSWAPVTGSPIVYGAFATGWSFSGGGFGNPLVEGTTIRSAVFTGSTFTP